MARAKGSKMKPDVVARSSATRRGKTRSAEQVARLSLGHLGLKSGGGGLADQPKRAK